MPQNTHLWPSIPENINTKSARVTLHKHIAVSVEFGNHHHNIYAGGGVSSKDLISILGPLLQEYDILDEEKEKCSENNKDDKTTNKVNYDQSDVSHNDTVNENTVVQEKNDSHKPKQGTTERNEKVHVLSTTGIESQIAECEPEHDNINKIAKDVTSIDLAIEADSYQYSNTVNSEVSGSASNKARSFGRNAKAERRAENKKKEPENVNAFNSEVSSPVNSKAFSSTDTAEDEMLLVKEEQPRRVIWSLKSHNNYSVLDKVMNVLNKGSFPTGAAPKKKESKVGPKDKTSTEVSEVETEIVQGTSDSTPAQPLTRCNNCRTNPCLDNQFITPKNLVFEKGHSRMERCTKSLSLKAIWGAEP